MTIISLFTMVCQSCIISEDKNQESLKLKIIDSSIKIKKGSSGVSISVRVINNIENDFLMYNFKTVEAAFLDKEDYINGDCSSGTALFILDKFDTELSPLAIMPDDINWQPITQGTLRNAFNRITKSFSESTIVAHKNSKSTFGIHLDFSDYELSEGEYKLFLIYYSGKNQYNLVPEDQVKTDVQKYNAKEFRGWVKSNMVKLIVE